MLGNLTVPSSLGLCLVTLHLVMYSTFYFFGSDTSDLGRLTLSQEIPAIPTKCWILALNQQQILLRALGSVCLEWRCISEWAATINKPSVTSIYDACYWRSTDQARETTEAWVKRASRKLQMRIKHGKSSEKIQNNPFHSEPLCCSYRGWPLGELLWWLFWQDVKIVPPSCDANMP